MVARACLQALTDAFVLRDRVPIVTSHRVAELIFPKIPADRKKQSAYYITFLSVYAFVGGALGLALLPAAIHLSKIYFP